MLARARPSRIPRPATVQVHIRSYSVSIEPSVAFPRHQDVTRVYSTRKTFLYNRYTRLFESSQESPIIFLHHADFDANRAIQIRKDIAVAAAKHATPLTPTEGSSSPAPPELPSFQVMNGRFFGVALRDYTSLDTSVNKESIAQMCSGAGFAVLRLPHLNPPQLNAILRVIDRTIPPKHIKTPEQLAKEKSDAERNFVPGRRPKRVKPEAIPELKLVGALIEGKVFTGQQVDDVAKLPTLETLRAQMVGLLSAPATQLAGILSQASGGKLARTLEGLKKSLEEGQKEDTPPST